MLDENCVHFIHGGKLYAVDSVTGLPFVAHRRIVNGRQRTSYFEIEYDQLPEQVKVWWTEYQEKNPIIGRRNGRLGCTRI